MKTTNYIWHPTATHAVTSREEIVNAVLLEQLHDLVLNFLFGSERHPGRIAERLDFVKTKKPRTRRGKRALGYGSRTLG